MAQEIDKLRDDLIEYIHAENAYRDRKNEVQLKTLQGKVEKLEALDMIIKKMCWKIEIPKEKLDNIPRIYFPMENLKYFASGGES